MSERVSERVTPREAIASKNVKIKPAKAEPGQAQSMLRYALN